MGFFLAGAAALAGMLAVSTPAFAGPSSRSGTTLAAVKTIDICAVSDNGTPEDLSDDVWRYSGEIALWNEGAVDTVGLAIQDCIQNKVGSGQFQDVYCTSTFDPPLPYVIPAGTTQLTATTFQYSIEGAPLPDYIRNIARVTITNHSGSLGTPKGPEPKATWTGGEPPACPQEELCGCTYTQGYWGSKPGVVWPDGFDRNAPFYLSGLTWQQILDGTAGGNGYFILAHQYIAAALNQANGACVPDGIQTVLSDAAAWFAINTQGTPKIGTGPSAIPATGCYVAGSCGTQKDWGAILDDYNNGVYPGSPGHCGDE
jgi:hypothetical protein